MLTNTLKHASVQRARVTIRYGRPLVTVEVTDDGISKPRRGANARCEGAAGPSGVGSAGGGHGIDGMRECAALHDGSLWAAPAIGGGWTVTATLRPDVPEAIS